MSSAACRLDAYVLMLSAAVLAAPVHAQTSSATDPQSCAEIWQAIGLPQDASGTGRQITIVCHLGYVTGHDDERKAPDWVVERLNPKLTEGKATRKNQAFSADPALSEDARAQPADYKSSGFDQGHNAPAGDFAGNQKFLNDTFFLSNSVPQIGRGFNRSIWRSLETQVRNLVGNDHPEMYIITGSVYQTGKPVKIAKDICGTELTLPVVEPASICPENHKNKNAECTAGVSVPAAMFKIVYDPVMQNAFAVLMENENHTGRYQSGHASDYIEAHRIGIATIEELTGLRFFAALSPRKQRQMRANCLDVREH